MKVVAILLPLYSIFYALFPGITLLNGIYMSALFFFSIFCAYLPSHIILSTKYPFILVTILSSALFLVKKEVVHPFLNPFIVFFSTYAFLFYVSRIEEKEYSLMKEYIGFSILSSSLIVNLYYTQTIIMVFPFFMAVVLALFIIRRPGSMPIIIFFMILAFVLFLGEPERATGSLAVKGLNYKVILVSCLFLFAISLVEFITNESLIKRMVFFGFLFISLSLLFPITFKVSPELLLRHPLFLLFLGPLSGLLMKKGEVS